MMKRTFLLLAVLWFGSSTLQAQTMRVYEHLTFSGTLNKNITPYFSYTQSLSFGKAMAFQVNAGARVSFIGLPKTDLEAKSEQNGTLAFKRSGNAFTLNFPVGVEAQLKFLSVGVNTDLFGYTVGKVRDSTFFQTSVPSGQYKDLTANGGGVNFLFSKKGNILSELYASATLSQVLTIKVGMATLRQNYTASYLTSANRRVKWDTFGKTQVLPFVGLSLNFER